MKNRYVSWSDIDSFIKAVKIETIPDLIVGVHRGGLSLAVMLSHKLDCPLSIAFSTREDISYLDVMIVPALYSNLTTFSYNRILIVDDISDSGKSLMRIKEYLLNFSDIKHIETLTYCIKTNTAFMPTYYSKQYKDDIWVVFPWEISK